VVKALVEQSWLIKDVESSPGSEIAEMTGGGKIGVGGEAAGKAFEQATIESPMGGVYRAQAAAEPGESVVCKKMNSLTGSDTGGVFGALVVEVLKLELFIVAPEETSEHCQHPGEGQVEEGLCESWKGREFGFLVNCHGQNQGRMDIRSHFLSIG